MKKISSFSSLWLQSSRNRTAMAILLAVFVIAMAALATPSVGFIVNEILAKGIVAKDINQHLEIARNPDGRVAPWEADIHTDGATDVYVQHLVLAPGGYSGWHTHPGILIATVASGSIDFYDANCRKRSFTTGQVYFESGSVHAIANSGGVNADLYLSYLIKHDAPRRIEADAPGCASVTGIP